MERCRHQIFDHKPYVLTVWLSWLRQIGGAIVFYTIIPLPQQWQLEFYKIARWAPWMGLLIGLFLVGGSAGLIALSVSDFLRGVGVVTLWVILTGGLHLDGVMDAADGLAVPDAARRLDVMSDSRVGAFGAMAAIILLLLKVGAIAELSSTTGHYGLLVAPIWGRWAQFLAIACYPYLKAEGKGAFHRRHLKLPQDLWPSLVLLTAIIILPILSQPHQWLIVLEMIGLSMGISWGVGIWFNDRFNGMTGDLYGAIVEWTEALTLCCFSLLTK